MKRALLVILFFLSLTVVTGIEPIYNYDSLTIEESITNDIVIIPTRSNYHVQYFDLHLSLFPLDSYHQTIIDTSFSPQPKDQTFSWVEPNDRTLNLDAKFTIKTNNKPVPIKEKVPFPLESIPLSIKEFVQPTDSIDTNENIRKLAQSLAQDVDDLFILEHRLSRWVNHNIEYNLSTLTANANYPSSWVLDSGYGVCDEITNLFISLNRALGIPARFVSGIAYSDSILFSEKWGNHGWAEVYFPGHGWVPYDITYQQYGEIDATHIEFKKDVDGTASSIEYQTKGLYYNFEPTVLDFNTKIISYGSLKKPKTNLELNIQEASVGFGSYNLFELTVKNMQDIYVVEEVTLAKALELEYFHPLRQSVVLKPYEEKKIYWLIKVDPNLEKNYVYTFPISVFAASGNKAETVFAVTSRSQVYDKNYMSQFIVEETLTLTSTSIDCEHEMEYLLEETITLKCTSQTMLDTICLLDECVENAKEAEFSFSPKSTGINTAIITTTNSEGKIKHFFTYQVQDQATINIANISITQNVEFEKFATLYVKLSKNSSANPRNVTMSLSHEMLQKEWFFSFLDKDKSFDIELPAQGYVVGENEFTISVTYLDSKNVWQTRNKTVTSSHAPLSKSQKVIVYYNTYAAKVIDLMTEYGISRYYAEISAPAIIMFVFFAIISGTKNITHMYIRRRKIVDIEELTKKQRKHSKKNKK